MRDIKVIDPRLAALEPLVGRLRKFHADVVELRGPDEVLFLRVRQLGNYTVVDWQVSDDVVTDLVKSLGSTWHVLYQLRRAELPLELDAERRDLMDMAVLAKAGVRS